MRTRWRSRSLTSHDDSESDRRTPDNGRRECDDDHSILLTPVLCNGPEAELSEEFCEGGGLVVGVEAAGVGRTQAWLPPKGAFWRPTRASLMPETMR